jgi:hypothetical protein
MNRFARDRRDRRPLRSSSAALLKRSRRSHERRSQPPLHIQQHPTGVRDRLYRPEHEIPRHLIEELLGIEIDHPVVLPAPLPACRERVMGRLVRPVAIGVRVKPMVRPFPQMHAHHRLRDPVCDRWHSQHSDPAAVRLGDLYRLDRGAGSRTPSSSDSRSCRGCPSDRPRTRRDPARPLPALPCWP